jgi:epoxyqueuosine reductase
VLRAYRDAGFALAGAAPAGPSADAPRFAEWLGAGKHGDMDFLEADPAIRADPRLLLEGTRSFVVVADQYATRNDPPAGVPSVDTSEAAAAQPAIGRVARYARGRNYHEVMKRRLHRVADALRIALPASEFRTCVDTAPVNERELAELAGLGWRAKNTMLIHPRLGSYLLLGVVATTLDLCDAAPKRVPESCGTCTRCIDACPTGAITPFSVDARRCISYLTIEHRGHVASELASRLDGWIFGCDVCQEVCPHNSPRTGDDAPDVGRAHEAYAPRTSTLPLLDVLGWHEDDRRKAFATSAMKRATLAMLRRTAILLAENAIVNVTTQRERDASTLRGLRSRIELAAMDPEAPELVRQTAAEALARLARTRT